MHQSIQNELFDLKQKLGPSPIASVFAGLDHLRYRIAPGTGPVLIEEIAARTGYRFTAVYEDQRSADLWYLLALDQSPQNIVLRESQEALEGFPRLEALAFRVADLKPVRHLLDHEGIVFSEEPWGIMTDILPGLGDRFIYLPNGAPPWQTTAAFAPVSAERAALNLLVITDERAAIGPLDHVAYRVPLERVEEAATLIMRLTAYAFASCYTVTDQNAETMVFRFGDHKPAIVVSYGWDSSSVVHHYTAKYGPRVHHTAFYTPQLRAVLQRQKALGLTFTTEALIGDESRGILQIFGTPSLWSHEITEYVERFGSFTGFFDKGNVGELMGSTKQFA